jgi:periplasmic glucans biosynthesis protein
MRPPLENQLPQRAGLPRCGAAGIPCNSTDTSHSGLKAKRRARRPERKDNLNVYSTPVHAGGTSASCRGFSLRRKSVRTQSKMACPPRSLANRMVAWALSCAIAVPTLAQAQAQAQAQAPGPAQAPAPTKPSFTHQIVQQLARQLAAKPHEPPSGILPKGLEALDYDQYRQIRFRRERTIWRGEGLNFELQVLPAGWLYKAPVEVNLVHNGAVHPLSADNGYFELGPLAVKLPPESRLGFSGLRINGPLNRPDVFDEIIVFQGASYFRALSRGQTYGLSARGLALNVGKQGGEEFPFFRSFWIEKPQQSASHIVIHALLDSPSIAGAYRFEVRPGVSTAIDVQATLYPRKVLDDVGLAPLTSMFLFSGIDRSRINDFRPAVHDSEGLAIINGWGERIWRPLNNPRRLQMSDFVDQSLHGFGLIQRSRDFARYQDLEAHYEKRPSAWVEPREAWGEGTVRLVEIPSDEEIHDNIVAFWKPAKPLPPGKAHAFHYTLSWPDHAPRSWPGAFVADTRAGLINGPQRKSGIIQFAVDFKGFAVEPETSLPSAKVEASSGAVSAPVVQRNPSIDGIRVSFGLDPKGAASSELRLALHINGKPVSESWLYRWTKD